jgi:hypothetical protein
MFHKKAENKVGHRKETHFSDHEGSESNGQGRMSVDNMADVRWTTASLKVEERNDTKEV